MGEIERCEAVPACDIVTTSMLHPTVDTITSYYSTVRMGRTELGLDFNVAAAEG